MDSKPRARLIANYLPQYHPIKENDEWWGKGYTEWVSVAQARPLFKGHEQPLLPGELGFYDLRLEETRLAQAILAKEHGIEAFCYWHYWLGGGKRLLERPFEEVLTSGKPDFPFCLGWANHSWKGVFFGAKNRKLIEQTYPGKSDYLEHFKLVFKAFSDKRYLTVNGKPLFVIFRPHEIPDCRLFTDYWRELAIDSGLSGIHFVGSDINVENKDEYGVDAVTYSNHRQIEKMAPQNRYIRAAYNRFFSKFFLKVYSYEDAMKYFLKPGPVPNDEYPSIIPNWDTTARLGKKAVILHHSTPELFAKHVSDVLNRTAHRNPEENIIFIKSWNEWAEGNYIEPDRIFGRRYLQVLREELGKKR